MHSEWETITAGQAREMVETAQCGRIPSTSVIERYSRDMAAGRWRKSPEPFVFDGEGTAKRVMRDGLQRSLALIKAGLMLAEEGKIHDPGDFSITVWSTQGTTEEIDEAFPYLNIGKNRTGWDFLSIEGRKNPTLLYAVARRIVLWEAGKATGNSFKPTRAEVLDILSPREGFTCEAELARVGLIEAAADFAANWKLKPPVPAPAVAGFLWWLLMQRSNADCEVFMEYLRTASGLTDEVKGQPHPLVILRNRLHQDYYDNKTRGNAVKQETVLYLCLRAWDAWRRGERMTKLQMPTKLTDGHFRNPR